MFQLDATYEMVTSRQADLRALARPAARHHSSAFSTPIGRAPLARVLNRLGSVLGGQAHPATVESAQSTP